MKKKKKKLASQHQQQQLSGALQCRCKTIFIVFRVVRLSMKVYRLSEICTADGQNITRESLIGDHVQFTNQLWPMQTKPGPKSFRCWRRMLSKMYLKKRYVTIKILYRYCDSWTKYITLRTTLSMM